MKVKLLMCLLIGFMFYISVASISVNALWWNSSWDYKKEIPIDATGLSIQDNYQLLINVSHVTDKMNSTFKDLRFTNGSENTLLSYWIEYNASSNYAETWVKIPAISNTTNTSIYMYYGNDAVATARDGDGTFIFFDNASGTIGDKWNTSEGDNTAAFSYASGYIQADWDTGGQMTRIKIADGPTVPNDMIMDYKQWVSGTQGLPGVMPRYISKDNNYDIWVPSADINLARMFKTVSGSRTEVSTTSGKSVSENVWHDMSVSAVGTTFKIYANEVLQHTATDANHATGKVGLFAYYDDPAVQRWDDVRVREYSANEANINYSFGAEQTSNVAPTIIANATSPSPLNADNDWLINGTVTDPEELTTMFYVLFHKNGAALGGVYEYNITNNTNSIVATLTEGNFTYGDNMTAEFWGGDGTVNTSKTNMTATVTNTLVCEEITSAGTYTMNHNLSSSGTCVTIAVDNVIVDGAGYTINYSQSAAGYGINLNAFTNGDNASIKNVNIVQGSAQSYSWGIRMAYSDNSNITNNTVITHGLESHPIYAYIATSNIILDNTLTTDGTASRGIFVYRGSHNNISGGSINSDKSYDYYIQDCGSTHNFTNTGFTEERDIYIYDAVSWFNYNNETGGNLWLKNKVSAQGYLNRTLTTWTQADMTWNDSASVALTASYNITGLTASTNHNVTNSTGGSSTTQIIATDATGKITFDIAMAQDANTELKVEEIAYVACGTLNSANTVYTLTQNISSTGTCFTIGAHNITLDGGGYTINFSTTSAGSGILNTAGYDNLTIKNTKISQYSTSSSSYGIQFNGVINSNITSNSIDIKGASSTGIFFWGENDNTVENNNITTTGSSSNGMYLTDSHDNNITNNEITISGASSDGVELTSGSTSNIFLNNTIFSNSASSNGFKLERGSYLTSITGGSIVSEKGYDYYLRAITCGISEPCGPSNNFTDTNFTAMRKLYFYDTTHWFNYNNETGGNIWLKTNLGTSDKSINRTLLNWSQTNITWTEKASASLTVSYNLTGLTASTNHNVTNSTSSASTSQTIATDAEGKLNFDIALANSVETTITVEKIRILKIDFVPPTETNGTTIYVNHTYVNTTITAEAGDNLTALFDWNYSLVGWWRFNNETGENTTFFKDWSSYENNGTCTNCPNYTTGKFGDALEFDGNNDYITVSNSVSLDSISSFTVSLWIKGSDPDCDGNNNYRILLKKTDSYAGTSTGFDVVYEDNGYLQYDLGNGTSFANRLHTSNGGYQVPFGTWDHLVFRFDNATFNQSYFVNGVHRYSQTVQGGIVWNSADFTVGKGGTTGACPIGNGYFPGLIDEVKFHSRALSPDEIKADYNAGLYRLENNFTDLAEGTYEYTAYVQNQVGTVNQTETRTLIVSTDECAPPVSGNWTLNMSLNCNISDETIHLGPSGWLKLIENGSASFINTILSAVGIEWESDIEARLNMSGTNVTFNWTG